MADPDPSLLTGLDLSQSVFRGSGALFQTDRLTLGRSKSPLVLPGKQQVIEKVVYVQGDEKQLGEVQAKLDEAMIRLVLTAIERDKLARQLTVMAQQRAGVFDHGERVEAQQLKTEVSRLRQLLTDKEKEIQFVKEAEIRKSAIQSGDLTLRLRLVVEENKRMQENNENRIGQIGALTAENAKLKDQIAALVVQTKSTSQSDIDQREIQLKNNEMKALRELISNIEKERNNLLSSQKQLMKELELARSQLVEVNTANEDLFRINSHLEQELEKSSANPVQAAELVKLQEANASLTRVLEGIQASNLKIRDEMARQAVEFSAKEQQLARQLENDRRESSLKIEARDKEMNNLRTQVSQLNARLEAVR